MQLRLTAAVLFLGVAAFAQTPAPNHEHWEAYFQAESRVNALKPGYEAAAAAQQAAIAALVKDCGDKAEPGLDPASSKGTCIAKKQPAQPAKPVKK